MGLPAVYLIGLLALFVGHEIVDSIPGQGDAVTLALVSLSLPVPLVLVGLALRAIRRRYVIGRLPFVEPELLLRLSAVTSPIVVYLVATEGGWSDFSWRLSGDRHALGLLLDGLPLLLVELPRMLLATKAAAWLEVEVDAVRTANGHLHLPSFGDLAGVMRLRLGWVAVVTLPWILLGIGLDLLALSRSGYALVLGTSFGMTGGFLMLLIVVALLLPLGFRFVFGATRALPEPLGGELRRTAAALDFDPAHVYLLPTGMSAVNAMMVGPLPVSRCLCITDGLVHVLDADALSGVVAHEVGHARMGHPGLLVLLAVILPLMLLQPFGMLPLDSVGTGWQIAGGLVFALVLWFVVRSLAHRFELEADVASVRALGAGPCSRALLSVSHATVSVRRSLLGRLSTLHPDETTRLSTMVRYEREPEFRAHFDATGRRLRLVIVTATLCATAGAVWTWSNDWTYERVLWRFHIGEFGAARSEKVAAEPELPERWQEAWRIYGAEIDAAMAMAPEADDWESATVAFRQLAWPRAVEALLRDGPAAATPWFALAADSLSEADPDYLLAHQLYAYCRAVRDGESARVDEIREVIRRRPLPAELQPVFG